MSEPVDNIPVFLKNVYSPACTLEWPAKPSPSKGTIQRRTEAFDKFVKVLHINEEMKDIYFINTQAR